MNNTLPKKDGLKDYLIEIPNFLSIFMFSIFFLAPSSILIEISTSINASPGDLSLIFTYFTIGGVIGQLTSVVYNIKFRKSQIINTALILLILFTFLLSFLSSLYLFYILYFIIGYLLGIIWVQAYNNILASKVQNKDRLSIIALSFFPVGAISSPLISTSIVRSGLSWRYIYYVIIIMFFIILIIHLIVLKKKEYEKILKPKNKILFKNIFINKSQNIIFIILAVLAFVYCVSETVMSAWFPTFFRMEGLLDIRSAGLMISIFWAAVLVGRVIISFLSGKIKTNHLILSLSIIAFVSLIYLIFSQRKYNIFIATGLAGLGHSGIFPLILSSGSTIYKKGREILVTIIIGSSNFGVAITPYLTRFTSKFNMTLSVYISVLFMGITIVILIFYLSLERRLKKH